MINRLVYMGLIKVLYNISVWNYENAFISDFVIVLRGGEIYE